jgi:hypothetical protein
MEVSGQHHFPPLYSLNGKLDGSESLSGGFGEEKNIPCPRRQRNHYLSVVHIVAQSLYRLCIHLVNNIVTCDTSEGRLNGRIVSGV